MFFFYEFDEINCTNVTNQDKCHTVVPYYINFPLKLDFYVLKIKIKVTFHVFSILNSKLLSKKLSM